MWTKKLINRTIVASVITFLLTGSSLKAKTLEFELFDSYGRKVSSQDYKGVPVFLEFGACW
jgi:hypothetical protein